MWREEESGFFRLLQGNISGSLLEHLRVDSFRLLRGQKIIFWVAFGAFESGFFGETTGFSGWLLGQTQNL